MRKIDKKKLEKKEAKKKRDMASNNKLKSERIGNELKQRLLEKWDIICKCGEFTSIEGDPIQRRYLFKYKEYGVDYEVFSMSLYELKVIGKEVSKWFHGHDLTDKEVVRSILAAISIWLCDMTFDERNTREVIK